jgi:phosphoglycolate phosphatase-like HAD superfamily hydrolase
MIQRIIRLAGAALLSLCITANIAAADDPLPSWNDGPTKQSILDFVTRVTKEGGPDYVAPKDRLATIDNDGTLWVEQPIYTQFAFAIDEVKAQADKHPEWKTTDPFKSILAGDMKGLAASGEKGMVEVMAATHSGMTTTDFDKTVKAWLETAKHPRFKVLYTDLIYQPMLELLGYLRANGFKTFIVSGGGVEFMRDFADKTYGIPPEQVIGSSGVTQYQMWDASPVLSSPRSCSSTTGRASPRASTISSGASRSSPSAIPTVTRRCWNGLLSASTSASWGSYITPIRCANTPMTGTPMSASSTRRSTRRLPKAGPWLT